MIKVTLKKQFGDRTVLDVDLQFEDGKIYAIIGANGSGKSTMLKIIDRQIKPTESTSNIDKSINVCYMSQSSYAFNMSTKANITIAIPSKTYFDKTNLFYKTRANRLIDELGLYQLRKKNASKLSGGETQKMALARCLVVKHDLLLLDEPSAAMDVAATSAAEKVLLDYHKEYNPTIIFATHSLNQAERIADYVIFLKDGTVREIADAKTFISNPQSEDLKEFLNKA